MPSFSGSSVTVTISSIPRFVLRPPPRDLLTGPPGGRLPSSPPEPKPPGLRPDCPALANPLVDCSYEVQPPTPPSLVGSGDGSSTSVGMDDWPSAWVVKALVVLEAPDTPLIKGRTAVVPLVEGVASFSTLCVWLLCSAGLPHGSASMFSRDSLRSLRDFKGESWGMS